MIAFLALLLALQATPELKQHVEAGLKAKHAGDLDTAARDAAHLTDVGFDSGRIVGNPEL